MNQPPMPPLPPSGSSNSKPPAGMPHKKLRIGGTLRYLRNRDTERQTDGDNHATQETQDVPPLAACVKTLPEAVQLSLNAGANQECLFLFARAIKAFEITQDRRLNKVELQSAFSLWWCTAKPVLPPDADMDEWRFVFEDTFAKTRAALGANSFQEAIRLASA